MNFSLLTYNVLYNKAFDKLGKIIDISSPDIICLQEIDTNENNLKNIEKFGYKLADFSNSFINLGKIYGVATFYNPNKIKFMESTTLQLPRSIYEMILLIIRILRGGNKPRTVLKTDFQLNNGAKITIYNTHLTVISTNQARVKQIKTIVDFIKNHIELPLIITGDLNYHPYARKQLEELMKKHNLQEATSNINYTMQLSSGKFANYNLFQKITSKLIQIIFKDRFKLDYMFYKNLKMIETKRIDIQFSDHFPIIATFKV